MNLENEYAKHFNTAGICRIDRETLHGLYDIRMDSYGITLHNKAPVGVKYIITEFITDLIENPLEYKELTTELNAVLTIEDDYEKELEVRDLFVKTLNAYADKLEMLSVIGDYIRIFTLESAGAIRKLIQSNKGNKYKRSVV
jgi:hypothetical protein